MSKMKWDQDYRELKSQSCKYWQKKSSKIARKNNWKRSERKSRCLNRLDWRHLPKKRVAASSFAVTFSGSSEWFSFLFLRRYFVEINQKIRITCVIIILGAYYGQALLFTYWARSAFFTVRSVLATPTEKRTNGRLTGKTRTALAILRVVRKLAPYFARAKNFTLVLRAALCHSRTMDAVSSFAMSMLAKISAAAITKGYAFTTKKGPSKNEIRTRDWATCAYSRFSL